MTGSPESSSEGPIVTVFRSRLRPDAEENGYGDLASQMEDRARAAPGFVGFKTFAAPDGERVSIIVFDTLDHHNAWRDNPSHRLAQEKGRECFYASYSIMVGQQLRRSDFHRDSHEPLD